MTISGMTIADLIAKLSRYPASARVTLLDPDKRWLLPIEVTHLPSEGSAREIDFIAITSDSASDEIEGVVNGPRWPGGIVASAGWPSLKQSLGGEGNGERRAVILPKPQKSAR